MVQDLATDQLADGSAGLEGRVQCEPGLRPQETVGNLLLDLGADLVVLDLQEALDEIFVVAQDLIEDTERVHGTSPFRGTEFSGDLTCVVGRL